MILAETVEGVSATTVGVWVIAGGVVVGILLNLVKLWRTSIGEPERRAVNVLAENATKDEVRALVAEIRELDNDVGELRREMKIDREALTRSAEERARVLTKDIQQVLEAVSELRGVVDVIRDKTTR